MTHLCGCGHCHCSENPTEKTPKEKVKELERKLEDLGYKVEKTPEGDIKISE